MMACRPTPGETEYDPRISDLGSPGGLALLGPTVTLLAHQGGLWLYRRSGMHPPPTSVLCGRRPAALPAADRTPTPPFEGAQFVHFLLDPPPSPWPSCPRPDPAGTRPGFAHRRRIAGWRPDGGPVGGGGRTLPGASGPTVLSLAESATTTPTMARGRTDRRHPSLTAVVPPHLRCRRLPSPFDRKASRPRPRGPRLCSGRGIPWHRHGACLQIDEETGAAAPGHGLNGRVHRPLAVPALGGLVVLTRRHRPERSGLGFYRMADRAFASQE